MQVVAKKRFGQHFLRDSVVTDRLLRLIRPSRNDVLIEVGAGSGILTARLAPLVDRLVAVELDRDVLPALADAVAAFPSVTVVNADILTVDLNALVERVADATLRAAGNLPYNIATAVIGKFLMSGLPFRDLTYMVQLEVAERITAAPGSKRYGYLSVQCQHLADTSLAFKVHPAAFRPPPKVMSAVIVLRPKPGFADPRLESTFSELVKSAFSHRRKMIANSFRQSPLLGQISERLLTEAKIDGSRRPEQLSVQEYENLARICLEIS